MKTRRVAHTGPGIRQPMLKATDDRPAARPRPATAVAALAVRVDGLRRRIETLATSIGDLSSTQQEHATVLDGIAELRRQVDQILAILGNDDEPSPGGVVLAHHDRPAA